MSIALSNAFCLVMLKTPLPLLPNPAGMLRWLAVVLIVLGRVVRMARLSRNSHLDGKGVGL